jgi:predicted Na+-dependent transporter
MPAYTQALLIQAVAFILSCTIMDGGRILNGVVASCLLFWITFFLVHRWRATRFDARFLRWGSVLFVLAGAFILTPIVDSILQSTLHPILQPAD